MWGSGRIDYLKIRWRESGQLQSPAAWPQMNQSTLAHLTGGSVDHGVRLNSKEMNNPCLTFILYSKFVNYLVTAVYHCVISVFIILCFWRSYTIWDRLCMPQVLKGPIFILGTSSGFGCKCTCVVYVTILKLQQTNSLAHFDSSANPGLLH